MFGRRAEKLNVESSWSYIWTVSERVGKHLLANRDKFYGKTAIEDHNVAISGQQKH